LQAGPSSSESAPATMLSVIFIISGWGTEFMPIKAALPTPIDGNAPVLSPTPWPSNTHSSWVLESTISWPDAIVSRKRFQPNATRCCGRSFSSRDGPFAWSTSHGASSMQLSRENARQQYGEAIGQAVTFDRFLAEFVT